VLTTRRIIDSFLSLQWCRENIVAPIDSRETPRRCITVAVGNFAYLATIGDFIGKKFAENGYETQFVQRTPEEIQEILNQAASERLISGDSIELYAFSDESVLQALQAADNESQGQGLRFDFDDSEDLEVEEDSLDLSSEMLGSEIQRAAAQILINSCRNGVSDIHIEPRESEYKIRVRRDGVMQSYVQMPRSAGIKLTACLKNMAKMDIAERRASQDGKILRRFEGQRMEFRCSTAPGKHGEKMVLRILNSNTDMLSLDSLITNENIRGEFRKVILLSMILGAIFNSFRSYLLKGKHSPSYSEHFYAKIQTSSSSVKHEIQRQLYHPWMPQKLGT